jgi:hypothetical protein
MRRWIMTRQTRRVPGRIQATTRSIRQLLCAGSWFTTPAIGHSADPDGDHPPLTAKDLPDPRRKPAAQPKSYRVVAEEVDGQKFQRVELAFRWMPWIMGGVLTVTLLLAYSAVRNVWLAGVIANEACVNQMLWVQPDLDWETPQVDEDILRLCYEREKLF